MPRRPTIALALAVIAVAAVLLGALREATAGWAIAATWTAYLVLLTVTVRAALGGRRAPGAVGFAVFGWGALLGSLSLTSIDDVLAMPFNWAVRRFLYPLNKNAVAIPEDSRPVEPRAPLQPVGPPVSFPDPTLEQRQQESRERDKYLQELLTYQEAQAQYVRETAAYWGAAVRYDDQKKALDRTLKQSREIGRSVLWMLAGLVGSALGPWLVPGRRRRLAASP